MSKIVLAFVSAAVVEEDGKVSIELVEDAPLAHGIPVVGAVLPAKETIPIVSIGDAVGGVRGALDGVRKLFGKK